MDLFQLIILGIVQGITEWIPISSKTQVTFVYLKVFQGNPSLVIPILLAVHLGTVVAATFYFRNEIAGILSDIAAHPRDFNRQANGKVGFLFTALLFTGIIGIPLLLAEKWFFPMLNGGLLYAVMGGGLIVTGFLLLSHKTGNTREIKDVSWKDGILTGALQGFSILPGISRSGTSTTGLIWQRFDSESSFYLQLPFKYPDSHTRRNHPELWECRIKGIAGLRLYRPLPRQFSRWVSYSRWLVESGKTGKYCVSGPFPWCAYNCCGFIGIRIIPVFDQSQDKTPF